ncbi:SprT family zinc-dependent metalloprotease [soil metagenome]
MTAPAQTLPPYAVRRSARARRARLTIGDTGEATVVLPARASQLVAAELVARHAGWLERHTRRINSQRLLLDARPGLRDGREVTIAGERRQIRIEAAGTGRRRSSVSLVDSAGELYLVVRLARADGRLPQVVLEEWLRQRARQVIAEQVRQRAAQLGARPAGMTVRDQRSRWASASARGTLSFSWRLLLCPPWVLDYVVVHELAHLRRAGHDRAFWALVERHVPAAVVADARRWLREQRLALHRALD